MGKGSRYKDLIQEGQRLERKSQRGRDGGEVGQGRLAEAVHGGVRRGKANRKGDWPQHRR